LFETPKPSRLEIIEMKARDVRNLALKVCLSTLALFQATAGFSDRTCHGRFPKANKQFAQKPDGCSSWSNNHHQVRDTWGPVDFRKACNDHDKCYYTLGSDPDKCNRKFCTALYKACENDLIGGWDPIRATLASPILGSCYTVATAYCGAVKAAQDGTFEDAQDMQREWLSCKDED
jgi:hypothetical protein